MLAKILIQLPYVVNVPDGELFEIYEEQLNGYKILFYPPLKSVHTLNSSVDLPAYFESIKPGAKFLLTHSMAIHVSKISNNEH